ncbi:hypothetical protein [Actinotalea sp.]|uniref:hypothetical protein n=1 Tax=Actinotalea sp. TaxID=1872145 RepID=UPI0035624686
MHSSTDAITAKNIARIADEKKVRIAQLGRVTRGLSEERLRAYLVHGKGSLIPAEVAAIAEALGVAPSDLTQGIAA